MVPSTDIYTELAIRELSSQISELNGEIAKLESERDSYRAAMERDGMFQTPNRKWMVGDERFAPRYQRLDELNDEISRKQQKLIGLQLASINSYSQQFNKSIGALNDSIKSLTINTNDSLKSLNNAIQRLLRSSTKLEILSSALIIGATASISLAVLPINASYAFYGLILVVTEGYWLILLPIISWVRRRRTSGGT